MDMLLTRKILEEAKNKGYSSLLDIACDMIKDFGVYRTNLDEYNRLIHLLYMKAMDGKWQ